MHHVIIRASIRRMCYAVNNQKLRCRPFSSSTNNTTASRENSSGKNNNPNDEIINAKCGSTVTSYSSFVVENATSKDGNGSSLSAVAGCKMPIGTSSMISPKPDHAAGNIADSDFVSKSSYSNNISSSDNDGAGSSGFRSVYVHPLSQIVLEYLQESHHAWVVAKGLDQSLTLHRDGSFELKHVPQPHTSIPTKSPIRPYSSLPQQKEHRKSNSEPIISASTSATASMKLQKNDQDTSDTVGSAKENQQNGHTQAIAPPSTDSSDNIRIWTSYDEEEKKHWLTVRQGLFRQRFLLQDNLLTAWQANRGSSFQERLHLAVDEMIGAVDRLDRQQQQHQTLSMKQQQWHQKGQRRFRKR